MTDESRGRPDKAGGRKAAPERRLTALQRAAGVERLNSPLAPEGEVLRRAGYSYATTRNPTENGIDSHKFARAIVRAEDPDDPSLASLDRSARKYIKQTLSDASVAPNTVKAPLALGTLKTVRDLGVSDNEDSGPVQPAEYWRRLIRHSQRHAAYFALRRVGMLDTPEAAAFLQRFADMRQAATRRRSEGIDA